MLSHIEKANGLIKIIRGKEENKIESIFMLSINIVFACTLNTMYSSGHSLKKDIRKANTEKGSKGDERWGMTSMYGSN